MFDMNKVARNIKNARMKKNMTQMNLADEMGVSYQAVSNWERGNSMPDISKLPELCKILDISFEDLVGERTAQTEVAEKMMQDENADVTLEEMAQVGQLVKPDKIENKVNETIKKEGKISFSALLGLAPFMDRETLGKMAEEIAEIDLSKLCAIAPFVETKILDKIAEQCVQTGNGSARSIVAIAPFLSQESIQRIADCLKEQNRSKELIIIAPFMNKVSFPTSWSEIVFDENERYDGEEEEEDDKEVNKKRAFDALEKGNDVSEYLEYMDEDDVAELAYKAMELGKPVEHYLDYMDEDDIKELLLKALKR